ncbi:serine O-acetyltransferase [Flavobacterium foetidum]|uniref:serine O-acetyltransferase n=1 Tax=Flavobacterium foetidum TaxID=2026681 RepID=UPI001074BB58|nr:serine acetyltransferase [Flavobacterium foetidum]KAF2513572.1 serine acetyltransferase [Flavobacterium foetidum]
MTLFQLIKSDYKKHLKYGGNFFVIVFFTQGFWASFHYRISHYIYKNVKWKIFRFPLLLWVLINQKIIEVLTGISIPASVTIGHSFYIGHFGGIIINANAVIGNNCNISQGVTVGVSGLGEKRGVPILGNNVYIGANAVIAGKIILGNDVLVSACSLVKDSFPDFSIISGVPAVVISQKGSKGYI